MRQFITLTILLAFVPSAFGYRHLLQAGLSPNHRFAVYATDTRAGKPSAPAYVVISLRSGAVLARLSSSYEDSSLLFDRQHTDSPTAAWSTDSHFVAIDEDVHRYVGELFLLRVSRAHAVRVHLQLSEIERATGQPWDRVSVHQPEWLSPSRLAVSLHGLLLAIPPAEPVHKEYDVVLEIGSGDAVRVRSLRVSPPDA